MNLYFNNRIYNSDSIKTDKERTEILYWMNLSPRISYNYALNAAVEFSHKNGYMLKIVFFITPHFLTLPARYRLFALEGLIEIKNTFSQMNIKLGFLEWNRENIIAVTSNAAAVFTEHPYLSEDFKTFENFTEISGIKPVMVDSNTVVPWFIASEKEDYNAAIFRRKIAKHLHNYLKFEKIIELNPVFSSKKQQLPEEIDLHDFYVKCKDEISDKDALYKPVFKGGYSHAIERMNHFIALKINEYTELRNDPSLDYSSELSPYLRSGQISPVEIALAVITDSESRHEKFLDELIVRRELSINFVSYSKNYESISCLPEWAAKTLNEHLIFDRNYIYSAEQFENFKTHDIYWNTCQKEMVITGKMHAYMRMYWGKKIIEWTPSPRTAFEIMVYLNNKYSLDGNDPNSYAGIAWCFGKHDRAFSERPVFGKVRYMNDKGLKRKFHMDEYVKKIQNL